MMQRLISAVSLTLMLSSWSAVAQVPPSTPLTSSPENRVVEAGLMNRTTSGDFRGDEILSRAELASILVKTFQIDRRTPPQTSSLPVQDVPLNHWAYSAIQTVLQNGVMTGYREGRFFPDQRVTRAEAFSIFAQAYGVFQFPDQTIDEILSAYPDASQLPAWARKSVATALYEGFINVDANNQINPSLPMTRADMAYALSQYLDRQQEPQ
jgi:hypothetical protein